MGILSNDYSLEKLAPKTDSQFAFLMANRKLVDQLLNELSGQKIDVSGVTAIIEQAYIVLKQYWNCLDDIAASIYDLRA